MAKEFVSYKVWRHSGLEGKRRKEGGMLYFVVNEWFDSASAGVLVINSAESYFTPPSAKNPLKIFSSRSQGESRQRSRLTYVTHTLPLPHLPQPQRHYSPPFLFLYHSTPTSSHYSSLHSSHSISFSFPLSLYKRLLYHSGYSTSAVLMEIE